MHRFSLVFLGALMACAACGAVEVYTHESRTFETPESYDFNATFPVNEWSDRIGVYFSTNFSEGGGTLNLVPPYAAGEERPQGEVMQFGPGPFSDARIYDVAEDERNIAVKFSLDEAQGDWLFIVTDMPTDRMIIAFIVGGGLMALVGMLAIFGWAFRKQPQLRWFFVGMLVWLVAILLKFGLGTALNGPIFSFLDANLPAGVYELAGSFYIGILTGITEIGITLAAVLLMRQVCERAVDAIALGVGAGAIEAILLGINTAALFVMVYLQTPGLESQTIITTALTAITPLAFLTGPVERVLAVLCHVASRTLVVYAVARKRSAGFWYGFFLLSAIDMIAGYVHVAELMGEVNMWLVELAMAPFALVSIYIIGWCMKHWPGEEGEPPTAVPVEGHVKKLDRFPLEEEG